MLHKTISAIQAETWEAINRGAAVERRRGAAGARPGGAPRQHGHRGADARAERQQPAMGRGPGNGAPAAEAQAWVGGSALAWRDHRRATKKRARDIQYTRGRPKRVQLYRELIKFTQVLAYLHQAARCGWPPRATSRSCSGGPRSATIGPMIEQIIAQTERRVLAGEPVPAAEAGRPVRAPCRHHPQGPRGRLRPQAQPNHRPQRLDPRCGDRGGQSGRQRAAAADARAPDRILWPGAASGRGR